MEQLEEFASSNCDDSSEDGFFSLTNADIISIDSLKNLNLAEDECEIHQVSNQFALQFLNEPNLNREYLNKCKKNYLIVKFRKHEKMGRVFVIDLSLEGFPVIKDIAATHLLDKEESFVLTGCET